MLKVFTFSLLAITLHSGVEGLCCECSIPSLPACLEEAIPRLGTEGFVSERRDRQQTGMLQFSRFSCGCLLEQGLFPGLCRGWEALRMAHVLFLMSLRAFSAPNTLCMPCL